MPKHLKDPNQLTNDRVINFFTTAFPNAFTDPKGPEGKFYRQEWAESLRDCLCAETCDKAVDVLRDNKFTEPVTVAFTLWEQATAHQVKPGWTKP